MFYERQMEIPSSWKSTWNSEGLLNHFIEDCFYMNDNTEVVNLVDLKYDNLIFENGQGLLLCDTGKDTFDTTPSNTGIRYSLELLEGLNVNEITAHYVSRTYLTRHGDGILIGETSPSLLSSDIKEDRTNHYNEGQGEFRYGKLDIDSLYERIRKDAHGVPFKLELTHCDEFDNTKEIAKVFHNFNTYESPII
jgi:adenylosuccinate synthase